MNTYAILCHPLAKKTYKQDRQTVLTSELKAIYRRLDISAQEFSLSDIAGIEYLCFSTEHELSNHFLNETARFSAFYAMFEIKGETLLPQNADPNYVFSESMPSLLNYRGKTNEQFTRLMINSALSACETNTPKKTLLDPVAGKGTTLYDAMMLGYNTYGVELSQKYFMESCNFAGKFMQTERFKHITKKEKILDPKSKKIADAYTLEFAPDKKKFNAKDTGILKLFCSDTRLADKLIKKNSVDMIVGDLPYGIHHANQKSSFKGERTRDAKELFNEAIPAWKDLLKKGGSLVLSFNQNTTSKENLTLSAEKSGLKVLTGDGFEGYGHQVDASIKRDLIAAVKG